MSGGPLGFEADDEHLFDAEYPPLEDDGDPGCKTCGDEVSYRTPDGDDVCHYCAGFYREEYGIACTPLVVAQGCE